MLQAGAGKTANASDCVRPPKPERPSLRAGPLSPSLCYADVTRKWRNWQTRQT